jgi:hypothetical protein
VTDSPTPSTPAPAPIPLDDPARELTLARPDSDPSLPHIGLVGDTYTILVAGQDTEGRYTLIDMLNRAGGTTLAMETAPRGRRFESSRGTLPGAQLCYGDGGPRSQDRLFAGCAFEMKVISGT